MKFEKQIDQIDDHNNEKEIQKLQNESVQLDEYKKETIITGDIQKEQNDQIQIEMPNTISNLEVSARIGFIRKVYSILSFQLLLTVILCVISMNWKQFYKFQCQNLWLFSIALVNYVIIFIILFCFKKISRSVPTNYILLFIFTLSEAYLVSAICASSQNPKIVLMAAVMTGAVTIGLTIYAFTNSTDFTLLGGLLFTFIVVLACFPLFLFVHGIMTKFLYALVCAFSAIIYGIYLIFDTQLILGSEYYCLSIDDYIVASMLIYVDIVVLFLRILRVLSILFGQE